MSTEQFIQEKAQGVIESLYGVKPDISLVQIQKTRKEFEGDYTLVAFPLLKMSKKSPEITCQEIGDALTKSCPEVKGFNVVKGFLNISLSLEYWANVLNSIIADKEFGFRQANSNDKPVVVEFSSPNTNKPLHLGHIRNNLLGFSISRILEKSGKRVYKVNLVNDRGIHICKSMIAWLKFGNGETPQSSGKKGDHLVGDYYVRFDKEYKTEISNLVALGMTEDEAKAKAPILLQAQELLRKWEAKDPETIALWSKMNGWVYEGFEKTYNSLGISFDKTYYESQTYLLGKSVVNDGLSRGVFKQKDDSSVWIDLTADGLDEKLLLRSDGTSVYITQDIGTAIERFNEFKFGEHIYVVGNEQEYHFQVLKLIMKNLGYEWSNALYHLSYGMVQLPEGKMKSREGTVVDADDLVSEMVNTAREMSEELGKLDDVDSGEAAYVNNIVGLGALKYFILKVDPKKNMTFNPKESIDFNGHTGPFIQYTHARIRSVLRKAGDIKLGTQIKPEQISSAKELDLIQMINLFPETVGISAESHNPAIIANYAYELAKEYNQFYHEFQIIKEANDGVRQFRLELSLQIADVIKRSMWLLGIEVPDKM
ncbi:MAG: arginine--tRNA ligase [Bacteroidales bacterium]|nr:MAG: arginine--tRNA ligase [Bacteroidales bacterium]